MNSLTETHLQKAETLLAPFATEFKKPEAHRLDAYVTVETFRPALEALVGARFGYIAAITGLDRPAPVNAEGVKQAEDQLEVLYHFCEAETVVTLRVAVPYSNPVLPTVCDLDPAATLYERELMELFGVTLEGTPNTDRLVLPDDWPDGVYPLRKSFTGFTTPEEPQVCELKLPAKE